MKTIIIILAFVPLVLFSQQSAQYNHYIFNQLVINPAYAGTKGTINVNGIYSSQWSGLEGSPTTQTISAEGMVLNNIGLGAHLVQDKIGAQTSTGFYGSYSYLLRISKSLRLSMGIATGVSHYSLDGNLLLNIEEDLDPAIPENMENVTRFDSKAGIFLFSEKFYAGFSISELTSNVRTSYEQLVAGNIRHYFLSAGYVFDISKDIKFKPGFLFKEDFRAPSNIDLNGFILFKNRFWLGATYRSGAAIFNSKELDKSLKNKDAVIVMTDLNISDNFRIGYAYTYSLSALSEFPGHEISLGYTFKPSKKAIMLTPRYF